jgi:hypothetical protein
MNITTVVCGNLAPGRTPPNGIIGGSGLVRIVNRDNGASLTLGVSLSRTEYKNCIPSNIPQKLTDKMTEVVERMLQRIREQPDCKYARKLFCLA